MSDDYTTEMLDELSTVPGFEPDPWLDTEADPSCCDPGCDDPGMQYPDTYDVDTTPAPDDLTDSPFEDLPPVEMDPDDGWLDPTQTPPEAPADTPVNDDPPIDDGERSPEEIAEDTSHWFQQGTDYTCAPSAMTTLIADFADIAIPDESAVSDWARNQPSTFNDGQMMLTDKGTYLPDMPSILEHFGIPSEHMEFDQEYPENFAQLDALLEQGHGVILGVNASYYWEGAIPGQPLGHAIRVVDIDLERGVAILSDSGVDNGRGLEVPLNLLENGWSAYSDGHEAIVTEGTESDAAELGAHVVDPATWTPQALPGIDAGPELPDLTETTPAVAPSHDPAYDPASFRLVDVEPDDGGLNGMVLIPFALVPAAAAYIVNRLRSSKS